MAFVITVIAIVLGTIGGIVWITSRGGGPHLAAALGILRGVADRTWGAVLRLYYDTLIPGFRMFRMAFVKALVGIAIGSFFLELGGWAALTFLTALGCAIYVFFSGWEGPFGLEAIIARLRSRDTTEQGRIARIFAGSVTIDITFPRTLRREPIIRVFPFDPAQDFELENVNRQGFTIRVPAIAGGDRDFRWTVRELPEHETIGSIVSSVFRALLVMSMVFLIGGLSAQSSLGILASAACIAIDVAIVFVAYKVFGNIARLTADMLELGPNAAWNLTSALVTQKYDQLGTILMRRVKSDAQAFNLINQEEIDPRRVEARNATIEKLIIFYAPAFVKPTWEWFAAWNFAGILGAALIWLYQRQADKFVKEATEANDKKRLEDAQEMRDKRAQLIKRGVFLLAIFSTLAILLRFAYLAIPGIASYIDNLWDAIVKNIKVVLETGTGLLNNATTWTALFVVSAIILAWVWRSTKNRAARFAVGLVFGTGAFVGILGIGYCLIHGPAAHASSRIQESIFERLVPQVTLEEVPQATPPPPPPGTTPTPPPPPKLQARIALPMDVPESVGYAIERRLATELKFTRLKHTNGADVVLTKGVRDWKDQGIVGPPGTEWRYRLIALIPKPGSTTGLYDEVPTQEVSLFIPFPAPPTPPPTAAGGGAPPAPTASGPVTNPGLQGYCSRNPQSKACQP